MHKVNIAKKLSLIENVLGVYRNYNSLDESWKKIVQIRIFIEPCIIVAFFVRIVLSNFSGFSLAELDNLTYIFTFGYALLTTINTLAAIILSYVNSKNFKEFLSNVNAVDHMYKDDATYIFFIKKQRKRFYLDVVLFTVAVTISTASYIYDSLFIVPSVMNITMYVYEISLQFRFFYESFVFFEYIEIIVVPLKFLNESMSAVVEKLNRQQEEMVTDKDMSEIRKELEKCAKASQLLVAASGDLHKCFGPQIAISLCSVTFYYITLLYQGISFIINSNLLSTTSMRSTMLELVCYVLMKTVVMAAGQRAHNEAEYLYRNTCAFNNLVLGCLEAAACARAAAGLARRLRAAPLRVRLLSSLAVQMALLPGILALVANYTVVLLQINHIV